MPEACGSKCQCSPGLPRAISTRLSWRDKLRHWGLRWGMGRMQASIAPGLYPVGRPDQHARVFVSANYRMSFDCLRAALDGISAWILVLDTKGINVWCAAGKGTFGTAEVVKRVYDCKLAGVVAHRRLILPQLSAPGVAAHEVAAQTGFRVEYGPVRAKDIPAYLAQEKAAPDMRLATFTLAERLAVAPMELVSGFWLMAGTGAAMCWLTGWNAGLIFFLLLLCTPFAIMAFHDRLPSRLLSLKGAFWGLMAWSGWALACGLAWTTAMPGILVGAAFSAYLGLNFTGATPYTSVNGVRREMRLTIPWMAVGSFAGLVWLIMMKVIG